jgi:shikimate dehydrogenase
MQINGQTKIIGLIGDPVTHSLSPAMHNTAYQVLNLNYIYVPFHVPPTNLPDAVQAIRTLNLTGVNVTVPHKETIIPYLDTLDSSAVRCGAVNTVVNQNGTLTGYNTDGNGFIDSLREYGFNPANKEAVILGAGGSARAIVAALLDNGATKLTIINRTEDKARQLAATLDPTKITVLPLAAQSPQIEGTPLIINTLAIPFRQEGGEWLLDLSSTAGALFYDLRYGRMPSDFLAYAKKLKSPGLDGLSMLLHQGARAFRLFTGKEAPVEEMRKVL